MSRFWTKRGKASIYAELGRLLGLQNPPDHIEAFDISNIGGQTIVGGMTYSAGEDPKKGCIRNSR